MNLNETPVATAKKEKEPKDIRWARIEEKFPKIKEEYQSFWQHAYDYSKKRRDFAILGKQIPTDMANGFGWKNPRVTNLLLNYINHTANQALQMDYYGNVSPNGGGSDIDAARAMSCVLRGQQRMQNSNQIYNLTTRDQIGCGIGYAMVRLGYATPDGFEKQLEDEYVEDWWNIFPDPYTKKPTNRFLVREEVPNQKWTERTGLKTDEMGGDAKREMWGWWERNVDEKTVYQGKDGKPLEDEDPEEDQVNSDDMGPISRQVASQNWTYYKIVNSKVVDEIEWLGEHPPIVGSTGERVVEETGKVFYRALSETAETPQFNLNIAMNILLIRMGKSPFGRYLIPFGGAVQKQIDDYVNSLKTGDTETILWYAGYTEDGKPLAPPKEVPPDPVDQSLIAFIQTQIQLIQRTFGIFDEALGEKTNAKTDGMFQGRREASDLATYNYRFNQLEFIKQFSLVKLDLIPKYMTAPQQVLFLDREDKGGIAWINQQNESGMSLFLKQTMKFSLAIEVGPSAETARQREADQLKELVTAAPELMQNPQIMALVVKSQPGMYAQQISEILAQNQSNPQLQAAQQQIQQLQGQLQQLAPKLQAAELKLQDKTEENQQAWFDLGTKRMEALAQIKVDGNQAIMDTYQELLKAHAGSIKASAEVFKAKAEVVKTVHETAKSIRESQQPTGTAQ